MNTLKLEKRGADFAAHDARVKDSDVGNYRLCTTGYTVPAKNGKTYFLEITRYDKYATRKTSLRGGKPLKHPVRELVAANVTHVSACFKDSKGACFSDLRPWREAFDNPRPYTLQGILDTVNSFAAVPYDGIEFA